METHCGECSVKPLTRGRARLGVLVPFTNVNLEADLAMLCPPGVTIHATRLGGYDLDEIPDETQMAGLGASDMTPELRLLAGTKPDVMIYGCTSATLAHGPEFDRNLTAQVSEQYGVPLVTAAGALVHSLQTIGAKRLAFSSPYVKSLNAQAIGFLQKSGFEVVSQSAVDGRLDNFAQGRLTPDDVCELARQADSEYADALVLSCTDMRAAEVVETLEAELGKPVITSNQALLYCALLHTDVDVTEVRCGHLFTRRGDPHSTGKLAL